MYGFEKSFDPELRAIPVARCELRGWLERSGIADDVADDVLIVVSELVTNGVIHDGGAPICVRAWTEEADLCLEVRTVDRPAGKPRPARPGTAPDERGRGLAIVAALSDDHTFTRWGRGRTAACRFSIA
jgi:anti-sigma regulatory factor (Ser/Thr protein kinase)